MKKLIIILIFINGCTLPEVLKSKTSQWETCWKKNENDIGEIVRKAIDGIDAKAVTCKEINTDKVTAIIYDKKVANFWFSKGDAVYCDLPIKKGRHCDAYKKEDKEKRRMKKPKNQKSKTKKKESDLMSPLEYY